MDNELLQAIEKIFDSKLTDIKADINDIKSEVLKTNLRIENELIPNTQKLLDGYKLVYEKLDRIDKKTDEMADTVLALDLIHLKK